MTHYDSYDSLKFIEKMPSFVQNIEILKPYYPNIETSQCLKAAGPGGPFPLVRVVLVDISVNLHPCPVSFLAFYWLSGPCWLTYKNHNISAFEKIIWNQTWVFFYAQKCPDLMAALTVPSMHRTMPYRFWSKTSKRSIKLPLARVHEGNKSRFDFLNPYFFLSYYTITHSH